MAEVTTAHRRRTDRRGDVRFESSISSDCGDTEILRVTNFGHEFPKHLHQTHALGIVDGGASKYRFSGVTYPAFRGFAITIPAGTVHTGGPLERRETYHYRMVYPSATWIREATDVLGIPEPSHWEPVSRDPELIAWIDRLHRALERGARYEAEAALYAVLLKLNPVGDGHPRRGSGGVPSFVSRVQDYLDGSVNRNVGLAELARLAGVHPLYLCRMFTRHVGMSPHAYLIHRRIVEAKRLLRCGTSAAHAAALTGFVDQSHMGRQFFKHVGTTPASYQSAIRAR